MCVYTCVCACVCICVYVYLQVYIMYVCICVSLSVLRTCMYICIRVYVYMFVYCMCVCMCIYRCVCIVCVYECVYVYVCINRHVYVCISEVSEVTQPCPTLCDPVDCSLPGFSVHGVLQACVQNPAQIYSSLGPSGWTPSAEPGQVPDN